MSVFEIIFYVITILSMFATIIGYLMHNKKVLISSFIALIGIAVLWAAFETFGVFPQ